MYVFVFFFYTFCFIFCVFYVFAYQNMDDPAHKFCKQNKQIWIYPPLQPSNLPPHRYHSLLLFTLPSFPPTLHKDIHKHTKKKKNQKSKITQTCIFQFFNFFLIFSNTLLLLSHFCFFNTHNTTTTTTTTTTFTVYFFP